MSDDGLRGFMRDVRRDGDLDTRNLKKGKAGAQTASKARNLQDQSIRTYLERLEKRGEMLRVSREVDPATNLAAIEWKTYDQLGKATLFDNILGRTSCSPPSAASSRRRSRPSSRTAPTRRARRSC